MARQTNICQLHVTGEQLLTHHLPLGSYCSLLVLYTSLIYGQYYMRTEIFRGRVYIIPLLVCLVLFKRFCFATKFKEWSYMVKQMTSLQKGFTMWIKLNLISPNCPVWCLISNRSLITWKGGKQAKVNSVNNGLNLC